LNRGIRVEERAVLSRFAGAVLRALLVVLLVATPSALVPGTPTDTTQVVALVAIVAAFLTFMEYNSASPSFVEFRDAPPFNRIRFGALLVAVFSLSVICRGKFEPSTITAFFHLIGVEISDLIDFPYSPVRLAVLMLPRTADAELVTSVRTAAGMSYFISILATAIFVLIVRLWHWPRRIGGFNLWTNLPTFEPSAGPDIAARLSRDGQINIILGFLLPFIIPAFVKFTSDIVDPISLANPHTLIWTMTAWAFLPASLLMRGIALGRIAQMIQDQRRRAALGGEGLQLV
jgi:hypothetical protein